MRSESYTRSRPSASRRAGSGLSSAIGTKPGGSAATTVGATAVGPSIQTLREHPDLVDRAAAQGRSLYCWTVDTFDDVDYCNDLGVAWIATNHPGRTRGRLETGRTGAGRDLPG